MRRWRLGIGLAALALASCELIDDLTYIGPEWVYWSDTEDSGSTTVRHAQIRSIEGWEGAESLAPVIVVRSSLYEDGTGSGTLVIGGDEGRHSCPRKGCFLYARAPDRPWVVLRAIAPEGVNRGVLFVLDPRAMQASLKSADKLELIVPIADKGSCTYTFAIDGYDHTAHMGAGPMQVRADDESPTEMDVEIQQMLAGPPPDWIEWPSCSGLNDA